MAKHIKPLFVLSIVFFSLVALTQSQIPDAITGNGQDPSGSTLEYFDGAQGYLAEASGENSKGSVILIPEWNGLVDRVRQVADAFATEGYTALAADLYSGRIGSNPQENMALVRETLAAPEVLTANLNAAFSYLKGRSDSNGKVATIDWCYGGGVALSFALGGEHHEGTAMFYGRLLNNPEELKKLNHEIYGTFARNDRGIPVEDVEQFAVTLKELGVPNDIHIYDPVQHGFWLYVDRDVENNTESAIHAWGRLQNFLKRTIGGGA